MELKNMVHVQDVIHVNKWTRRSRKSPTDGYQQCVTSYDYPMIITQPGLWKYESPDLASPTTCSITFRAPQGKFVELVFTELNLGLLEMNYRHVNSCADQYMGRVVVKDGSAPSDAPIIGHHLCGQIYQLTPEQLVRRSTGNVAGIIYNNIGNRFQVQFNIVDTPGKTVCPSTVVELSGSGTIKFPVNEDIYVQSFDCSWKVTASPGKKVKLINKRNDIGGYRYWPDNGCIFVALDVYDNPSFMPPPMQQFCFGIVGKDVREMTSTGNAITMKFTAYELYTGTGFEMDYEEI